jgi:hypothetical protein
MKDGTHAGWGIDEQWPRTKKAVDTSEKDIGKDGYDYAEFMSNDKAEYLFLQSLLDPLVPRGSVGASLERAELEDRKKAAEARHSFDEWVDTFADDETFHFESC